VGFSASDLSSGKPVFGYRSNELFTPASILKLLTSYVALKDLGPDYRFTTNVLVAAGENGRDVFIQAGADPNLRTEDLEIIARRILANAGKKLQGVYVDPSLVISTRERQGQRAYEAGSAALVFNFNSVLFEVCPASPGNAALVRTDPFEYSVQTSGQIATTTGAGGTYGIDEASAGTYRLSGSIGSKRQCGRHYRSVQDSSSYFLDVLGGRLRSLGVGFNTSGVKSAPAKATLVYAHQSKALSQILEDLNHFSTNLIAEQVVTAIGRKVSGHMSHAEGVARLEAVARTWGASGVELFDASGLSRKNKITPQSLLRVLEVAKNDVKVGVEFEKSLSVLGRNGTLKNRGVDTRSVVLRGKTGTLNGVVSLAGYVYTPAGKTVGFVMIQNGADSPGEMRRREDRVVKILNGVE
jgi:D-alanyl-D-alanine carboxypeptidase/D-alanyl-D-alanine-endopeptidase (penicillin-binding protein 4)